jgi:hypothetical protein
VVSRPSRRVVLHVHRMALFVALGSCCGLLPCLLRSMLRYTLRSRDAFGASPLKRTVRIDRDAEIDVRGACRTEQRSASAALRLAQWTVASASLTLHSLSAAKM